MGSKAQTKKIQNFIFEKVDHYPSAISQMVQAKFGISRNGAYYHLNSLVKKGLLATEGHLKAKRYREAPQKTWTKHYALSGLREDVVWGSLNEGNNLPELNSDRAGFTLMYGFTEMLNNAIDHSEGANVSVTIEVFYTKIKVTIADDGVGIFKKIQREENLENEREAILLLSKGKYTSMPEQHSGQGIFFTSKAFDFFDIISSGLCFIHERESCNDWLLDSIVRNAGTTVIMEVSINSKLSMEKLFGEFTSDDGDFRFDTTVVPVKKLKSSNEGLVSRSQAKRLMVGLHKFDKVHLDFEGVDRVGQAFADEIFRVWSKQYPSILLEIDKANSNVSNMISRVER